jgi:hypothetical protein
VVDDVTTRHRGCQRLVVEDVAVAAFHVEVVDSSGGAGLSQHDADVVTVGHQLARHVGAEEATGAEDEFLHGACRGVDSPSFTIGSIGCATAQLRRTWVTATVIARFAWR